MSFDLAARTAVLETPPTDLAAYSGIDVIAGAIAGDTGSAKIEFWLQVISGKIDLVFDRERKTLIWPGIDSNTIRPTMMHSCEEMPVRSILDFREREPAKAPISIRCEDAGAMYFTLDVSSKRAVFERGAEGRHFEGRVLDADDTEVTLEMQFDGLRRVVWNRAQSTIVVKGPVTASRDVAMNCFKASPRTMLVYADKLTRR